MTGELPSACGANGKFTSSSSTGTFSEDWRVAQRTESGQKCFSYELMLIINFCKCSIFFPGSAVLSKFRKHFVFSWWFIVLLNWTDVKTINDITLQFVSLYYAGSGGVGPGKRQFC